jgi:LacI family transcriptional regulator
VSCVLNGRADAARISPATAEKIRLIAQDMGYEPNKLAQWLGTGRSNVIGMMAPTLHNPFFLGMLETADRLARASGYEVLADLSSLSQSDENTRNRLTGWPVDGLLMWLTPDQSVSDYAGGWARGVPTVCLGYLRSDNVDYVAIDREVGVRQLMKHLFDKGYRKIAFLSANRPTSPTGGVRSDVYYHQTYERVCAETGLQTRMLDLDHASPTGGSADIPHKYLREAGYITGARIAKLAPEDRPEVIICHNDLVAIGMIWSLRCAGLRIPEDIAIAGIDGLDEGLHIDPVLTSVVSPTTLLIEHAFGILQQRIEHFNREPMPTQKFLLPSSLRVGGST